jgi:phage antirepressor YoqD-like protein
MAQRAKVAEAAVEAARPAVEFVGALADGDGTWGLQAAGKALGQGPNLFVAWLEKEGDLFRLGGGLVAKQRLIDRGFYQVVWAEHGGKQRPTTRLTGKGIVHYAGRLGVRPPQVRAQALLPGF